ncbi:putative diguanylate cyclase YeaP [Sporomusa ovata DSM 2662]|uniref:Diguanylate cyclase n=2 Tax=Sporomusa ovata TaxID=2378 RepID=A0A0U1KUF3_9FIRM|nr:diguanylate cyclase [Sporomusa ovata DSM 2662]CQR70719.1 Diguanylate cyclase [Sporomusa ovata]
MIRYVFDIMIKKYFIVDVLDGLRYIQSLVAENPCDGFPVMEDDQIVGVLTYKNLLQAHPNRIAADAMSDHIVYIDAHSSIWKAKEVFDTNNTDLLLVLDNNHLVGIITKSLLEVELGKHTDLLTELPKSDFIYYNATRLIENNQEMSLAFFDVNNFGLIDKEHGHIAGDIILKELGTILKTNMTEQTYVSRFGGDEFLVLTPYYVDKCCIFAQNLLKTISRYTFHKNISVTVSAGIVERKKNQESSQNILRTISNLINLASLASTKAKKDKCELSIATNNTTCNFSF